MPSNITTDIQIALNYLTQGELVAFPTETVYGLGADARNPEAIAKVFAAKGRPADHPLIVHIASANQLENWAAEITPSARVLAECFWPGPLTMLLPKHPSVSPLITGGQDTIALRIPKHDLTLKLLTALNSGLVGPSANKYGRISPTTAQHVAHDLGDNVAAILDGGPCTMGIESTIVNLCGDEAVIMRQGAITATQLATTLGYMPKVNSNLGTSIRTSGSHLSHYAPTVAAFLMSKEDLNSTAVDLSAKNKLFSVISFSSKPTNVAAEILWQQMPTDPKLYAQILYATLRAHDQRNSTAILIEDVPDTVEWAAIKDRLTRACFKEQI